VTRSVRLKSTEQVCYGDLVRFGSEADTYLSPIRVRQGPISEVPNRQFDVVVASFINSGATKVLVVMRAPAATMLVRGEAKFKGNLFQR